MAKKVTPEERLFQIAFHTVKTSWGAPFYLLGQSLQRGLLAEELMFLIVQQDEAIKDARVRELITYFWQRLREVTE